jgi:hypothetical protein
VPGVCFVHACTIPCPACVSRSSVRAGLCIDVHHIDLSLVVRACGHHAHEGSILRPANTRDFGSLRCLAKRSALGIRNTTLSDERINRCLVYLTLSDEHVKEPGGSFGKSRVSHPCHLYPPHLSGWPKITAILLTGR